MFRVAYYDPKAADVWSVAIIFCVMILGHFPWGIARDENTAFHQFSLQNMDYVRSKPPNHRLRNGSKTDENANNQNRNLSDGEIAESAERVQASDGSEHQFSVRRKPLPVTDNKPSSPTSLAKESSQPC